MKKSVLTLLAIAALSVASFSSCSNDGDSNNPDPTPVPTNTTTYVSAESSVTADVLELFDVQVVRTSGTSTQTYSFNNDVMLNDSIPSKATAVDKFELDKSTGAKITATITLKPNWQDIVKARGNKPYNFEGRTVASTTKTPVLDNDKVTVVEPGDLTQYGLEDIASLLKLHIDANLK